jgi:cytochrome c oxidase assembly factor CtaG
MTDALADVVVILAILAMPAALAQSGVPDPARTPGALNSMNTQKTMRHPLASAAPSHGSRR